MKKIFVGNLSWKVTEEILKPLFEKFGPVVSIKIVVDQYTGKSKGFGFVEMESAESAAQAIAALNDQPLLERNLRVSLAQPRPDRPREGGNGGGGYPRREREFGDRSGQGQRPFRPRSNDRGFGG